MAKEQRVRVNESVRAPQVRLISADGEQLGVVSADQALKIAQEAGLDLVEVAPNAAPPVCRVMDYGKYKYEQAKKLQEAKKKQAQTQVKEVKMRPKIDENDFQVKMRNVQRFLEERNRVKVTVQFRGREIAYAEAGERLLARVAETVQEMASVDAPPSRMGRLMHMILAPK
ncbi:translation initiation factor IF-3 [Desulfarculus baarsii DSM 2075]|uniref:Translation initiation factor IF-3 n=1 Tax=Desulfarculus baarsii (strain ATCC 33931 / DSM 2075 / LMG 7858 / VKM B-1802 / 2st14) TaxID=644282 RepID=E1QF63_DESB2|nr:translation initiation factor IF-3 [Desulfarculus baarsii DSM 2075]